MLRTLLLLLLAPLASTADLKPRVDAEGFPLPTEAVRRFGSAKFCTEPPRSVAFSPDGKTVYLVLADGVQFVRGQSTPAITAWDLDTGRMKWEFVSDALKGRQVTTDPDGKTIWLLGNTGQGDTSKLPFFRLKLAADTGKELDRKQLHVGLPRAFDLLPDGTVAWERMDRQANDLSLAVTKPDGVEQARWDPNNHFIHHVRFAPDGETLFVGGNVFQEKSYNLAAVNAKTGKSRWVIGCEDVKTLVVSPDSKVLVTSTAGAVIQDDPKWKGMGLRAARLIGRDATTGVEVGSCEVPNLPFGAFRVGEGEIGRLFSFSPGGSKILIRDLDRQVVSIDVKTWTVTDSNAKGSAYGWLTPDQKRYLDHTGRHLTVYDASTHEPAAGSPSPLVHQPDFNSTGLRFSADCERLIRGRGQSERVTWEVASGREMSREPWTEVARVGVSEQVRFWSDTPHSITAPNGLFNLRAKPDATTVLQVISASNQNRVAELQSVPARTNLAFTPDARYLVAANTHIGIWVWNTARGGEPDRATAERRKEDGGWSDPIRFHPTAHRIAFLEQNTSFLSAPGQQAWRIAVFDLAPAKRLKAWSGSGTVLWFDYTRQGRIVGGLRHEQRGNLESHSLFEIDPEADKPLIHPVDVPIGYGAISPDGRTLAVGTKDDIHLYELATGKRRHTLVELTRPAEMMAFSPDGRFLATESADGPVLTWDVRGDLTKPVKPDATAWDAAWKALGGEDAPAAFRAVRLFALYADEGAVELTKRFTALKPPSVEAIAALVKRLEDRDFKTREQAVKELKAIGFAAHPTLKKAIDGNPSEELRARASELLAVAVPPDLLRAERAVEALTLAGTEDAKKLLGEWAKGPTSDPLTAAAKRIP